MSREQHGNSNTSLLPAPQNRLSTYTFLVIISLLRQRAHIFTVKVVPSISVFTFTRLGFHVRRVRFLAWLTLLPVVVCFPHRSQVLDIESFLKISMLNQPSTLRRKCKGPVLFSFTAPPVGLNLTRNLGHRLPVCGSAPHASWQILRNTWGCQISPIAV